MQKESLIGGHLEIFSVIISMLGAFLAKFLPRFGILKPTIEPGRAVAECGTVYQCPATIVDQLEHPWGFWEAETTKILPKMSNLGAFLAKYLPELGF